MCSCALFAANSRQFRTAGIMVDRETLSRSWRCSAAECEFITGQLNTRIAAHVTQR